MISVSIFLASVKDALSIPWKTVLINGVLDQELYCALCTKMERHSLMII